MTQSDWISLLAGIGSIIAILAAPLVTLWIGGHLQRQSDAKASKLRLLSTLVSLRHDSASEEIVRALNSIDIVFVDEPSVREAWSRYFVALNDGNLNNSTGYSLREERRRDLLLEIVRVMKLNDKISTTDLLRTYTPNVVAERNYVSTIERLNRIAELQESLTKRNIPFPPNPAPWNTKLPLPKTSQGGPAPGPTGNGGVAP